MAAYVPADLLISIHALREEGDYKARGTAGPPGQISIHALREEGDGPICQRLECFKISIHALREEGDQGRLCELPHIRQFLSTPSARRATAIRRWKRWS